MHELNSLGKRIKFFREKQKLTQQQLSNTLHVSPQAVSKWERSETMPDISLLEPLCQLLDISIDRLVTGSDSSPKTFDAVVFCTSIRGFAKRSLNFTPKENALYLNGIFQTLTEIILEFGGVPVKYLGDGFLAYFSGNDKQERSTGAAKKCLDLVSDKNLVIALKEGPIYVGPIGHSDYARPDIIGPTVNECFLANSKASDSGETFWVGF